MKSFNYNGYTEQQLLELCNEDYAYKGDSEWKYWTAEVYSFGNHIRKYGFYPRLLPLYVYTEHGANASAWKEIPKHELEHDAYCQFYHTPSVVEMYKKVSKKPCFTLFSPFVFYRRNNKIQKSSTAKGTLAFPAHSTPDIENMSNIEEYIFQLKSLPEEFQPVCVCLHMCDIHKGQYKLYQKHGIPVYTAGHTKDFRFAERFYNVLKHFRYSTSNIVGSYTYYSSEMGTPFFVYGNKPLFINNSDPNLAKGEFKFQEVDNYIKIYKMFEEPKPIVTDEQRLFIEEGLGIKKGISRIKMAQVLYTAYFLKGGIMDSLISVFKYIKRYPLFLFRKDFWSRPK